MRLEDFHYDLPDKLIARYPLPERSASRLLCLDRTYGSITHTTFAHIIDFLLPGGGR